MKTNNILIGLSLFSASHALSAAGFVASVEQIKGVVLVDQGSAYTTAESGQGLKANDRIFVLNGASVLIQYADGCTIKVDQNTIFSIQSENNCHSVASNTKFTQPHYAAAIGAVEATAPSKEPEVVKQGAESAPEKVRASSVLGGVEEWEKPAADVAKTSAPAATLETAQTPPSLLATLAPKLAIPATLTGAVLFSALAGGGGEKGKDASPQ